MENEIKEDVKESNNETSQEISAEIKNETKEEKFGQNDKIITLLKKLIKREKVIRGILIIAVIIFIFTFFIGKKTSRVTTIDVSAILKEVNEIHELSVLTIPYNSVYRAEEPKKKVKDKTKYKYYVAYNGTVTMGFDLKNIKMRDDKEKKCLVIALPTIEILEKQVDHNSLEIIYVNEKYKKDGSIIELRKECDSDLENKINSDDNIYKMAKDSAEITIKNFVEPIVMSVDKNYTVTFE